MDRVISRQAARRGGMPLYRQIKEMILEGIASGAYGVGERVPSEPELVARFRVSRMTANRALRELADAGFVKRIPGVGTFVADRRAQGALLAIRDIAEELAEQGHVHGRRVLAHSRVAASRDLAERFGLAEGATLIHARVLHCRDGVPVLIEDRYVNERVAPGYLHIDLSRETSYAYLTRVAPLEEVEHRIHAMAPPPDIRELLALAPHEPCLVVCRRTWSKGEVTSVAELLHAGSRYDIRGRFRP
ncbi:MAG: histidine utilization repressor [Rhodothalassiaceae bacterium]